jgi:hypothetical protein
MRRAKFCNVLAAVWLIACEAVRAERGLFGNRTPGRPRGAELGTDEASTTTGVPAGLTRRCPPLSTHHSPLPARYLPPATRQSPLSTRSPPPATPTRHPPRARRGSGRQRLRLYFRCRFSPPLAA